MYHDQGHGPIKVLGLEAGVNITVGLPVIRTSVDHGTAFDIAGKGVADERSLIEALRQAAELAPKAVLRPLDERPPRKWPFGGSARRRKANTGHAAPHRRPCRAEDLIPLRSTGRRSPRMRHHPLGIAND